MMNISSRRDWLARTSCGFGSLALSALASPGADASRPLHDPLAAKPPMFSAKAKRIIFLFMQGGVSHVDSYDYKPRLDRDDGKQLPFDDARAIANSGTRGSQKR
ncbi:MAG TPA: DUF1501 domain-containing protein, partial [Urbifossiella sp.]